MPNEKYWKRSFKFLITLTIATITIGLVIYPLLDYLYYTFITNSEFAYLVQKHIIKPIFIGIFIVYDIINVFIIILTCN